MILTYKIVYILEMIEFLTYVHEAFFYSQYNVYYLPYKCWMIFFITLYLKYIKIGNYWNFIFKLHILVEPE